jgi:hypothetical protein
MVQGSEGREEEPFIMVQGRRKKKQKKEKGLQPPATTRPALPPPPGRHCRWAHPGTAAPLTPALPAQARIPPAVRLAEKWRLAVALLHQCARRGSRSPQAQTRQHPT